MALEIKQSLRLSQQLVITPQLQQAIKLLQLTRLELQTLVQQELVENPVLEETPDEPSEEEVAEEASQITEPAALVHEAKDQPTEEVSSETKDFKEPSDFDWENYIGAYNTAEMTAPTTVKREVLSAEDLPTFENTATGKESLQDHLLWQLHMSNWDRDQVEIAEEIIGSINDDGYLSLSIAEMAEKAGVDPAQIEKVLKKVQGFDPIGVGARDLAECLSLQIDQLGDDLPKNYLRRIVSNHMNDLERKNYPAIAKACGLSEEKVAELVHVVSCLEPKPGRPYGGEAPQYIVPDVHVNKLIDDYIVTLNDEGLPRLQISSFYRNAMMQKKVPEQTKDYIQNKLRSAVWLIKSIHQRQKTLYKVTSSIVKFQKEFFDKGPEALKPLILRDVAQDIGMHESTVSRVTTRKYAQTPRGLFELKYFFNTKMPLSTGESTTSESIKNEIKKLIDGEDPRKPYSDQEIVELLTGAKIQVARRTVAKYREMIGISSSSRRRRAS